MPRYSFCYKWFPNSPKTYLEVGWIIVGSISEVQEKIRPYLEDYKAPRYSFLDPSAPLFSPPASCLKPAETRKHSRMGVSSSLHSTCWESRCNCRMVPYLEALLFLSLQRQVLKMGTLCMAPLKQKACHHLRGEPCRSSRAEPWVVFYPAISFRGDESKCVSQAAHPVLQGLVYLRVGPK